MNNQQQRSEDVLSFWFTEIERKLRFGKDPEFDQQIVNRFSSLHLKARSGELFDWRGSASGSLAEIIILDQFSRNIFRDHAEAFAYDTLALVLAQQAIEKNFDRDLDTEKKAFLYMPFMHSESLAIHTIAVVLFGQPGLEDNLRFELRHKAIIDEFGRYPHRNAILGRESTVQETQFLLLPGSAF